MKSLLLYVILQLTVLTSSSELSRCCSSGSRHFAQTNTCSNIQAPGSSITCIRSTSICCLRALLDNHCDKGVQLARKDEQCPSNINVLAGGIKKECCDCCLLARELMMRNEDCVVPVGFSTTCVRAFSKCCVQPMAPRSRNQLVSGSSISDSSLQIGDRCLTSKCDHFCNDRGGSAVECSCRPGFDLAEDGYSCIDVNECFTAVPCDRRREKCVNTIGGHLCQPLHPRLRADQPRRFVRMRDSPSKGPKIDLLMADEPQVEKVSACPKGWFFNNGRCDDVDECNLGSHDCGPLYQCRNTQGSYRCDAKKCAEGELQNPVTGECTSVDCPMGYKPKNGICMDVDECEGGDQCLVSEDCINTPGSYRCEQKGNFCSFGYKVNPNTGFCEDIDECSEGNMCDDLQCINLIGSFKCRCSVGFEWNEKTKHCEDVNECVKFAGHVCDHSAECHNTIGSFQCKCRLGFQLAADGRRCEDVNECEIGGTKCEQKCVNIPGSYQCLCDRGFVLGADGISCDDIDECSLWAASSNDLCMGGCINTRGSYLCQCPKGYQIQPDGRTCVDIDECKQGECAGDGQVCVNTLGAFKCHFIRCPHNFVLDSSSKNRCVRMKGLCQGLSDAVCKKQHPVHHTWQYIAIPRAVPITAQRPSITLFTIKGPSQMSALVQFELQLKKSTPESIGILPASRTNFLLQKGVERNSAVIALRDSLDGPQMVELSLVLRLTKNGVFSGRFVANLVVHVSEHRKHSHGM